MRRLHHIVALACVLATCIAASQGGRPSARYLPPAVSGGGGGHFGGGGGGHFGGAGPARPSNQYLAPQASTLHYHGVSGAGHRVPQQHQQSHHAISGATRFAPGRGAGGGFGGAGGAGGAGGGGAAIPILRQHSHSNDGSGNYDFGFETGNGIQRDETGEFNGGWPHGSLNVKGSYSYTGDDGKTYTVNYKADSNGFHAEGDHIPTAATHAAGGAGGGGRHYGGGVGGGHGGVGGGGGGGHGGSGYHRSAAASAPSTRYLPPGYRRRRHY